jgi:hypothetical protein
VSTETVETLASICNFDRQAQHHALLQVAGFMKYRKTHTVQVQNACHPLKLRPIEIVGIMSLISINPVLNSA